MPPVRTTINLAGDDVPGFEIGSGNPRVSVIGGIHGCEYSSIAAVTKLMRELEQTDVNGTVVGVPVVSMESFKARSPFVVPEDGKNLNRRFPGDPNGTYTDRLAHDIFTQLIEPADAVLDLHGGDLVEALEPFALYHQPEARELAMAFNLPYVVDSQGTLEGTTSGAGRLGFIAEAGGIGQLEKGAVELLTSGAKNALKVLKVLEGEPEPSRSQVVDRFEWVYSGPGGFWVANVKTGERVTEGQPLGEIRDLYGDVRQAVAAPVDGVVLFLTTSAAVAENGLLMGLGSQR
jgi:predicted deacylase